MPGLSFLYPLFLIGAAAIAVPVLLHLLRREAAPKLPFSAVRFLRHAPVENTRLRRLRELLLLALRVAALAALAIAFARPYLVAGAGVPTGPVTVVALDTSFSMAGGQRFAAARQLARAAVREAPADHAVALVAFDDRARTVLPAGRSRGDAEREIDRLEPGYGATTFQAAVAHAAAEIGGREGRLVVVTDLQQSGWQKEAPGGLPERIDVEVVEVPGSPANLGVSDLRRDSGRLVAFIVSSDEQARTARVRLAIDGREAETLTAEIAPGATAELRFSGSSPAASVATVEIDDPSGFPADDRRDVLPEEVGSASIVAIGATGRVGDDALYVSKALLVTGPKGPLFSLTMLSAGDLSKDETDRLGQASVILLLSTQGMDRRGRDRLAALVRGGGGLLAAAGAGSDPRALAGLFGDDPVVPIREGGPVDGLSLAVQDSRHPMFRAIAPTIGAIGRARFSRAENLREGEGIQVLARFGNGLPALIEQRVGAGRLLVFASDLNNRWNDLPLQPAFVPFLHEALGYLGGSRKPAHAFVVGDQPADVPARPGVHQIGDAGRRVAVTVDPRESDGRRSSVEQFERAIRRTSDGTVSEPGTEVVEVERGQAYWRLAVVLMLAALAAEGLLGARMG